MARKTKERRKMERLCLRAMLRQQGMREGMLDMHKWLVNHPGWHESDRLADVLDVGKPTVFRWANVLVDKGYLEREEAEGIQEEGGEGGRLPARFAAKRAKARVSLRKKFDDEAARRAGKLMQNWGVAG